MKHFKPLFLIALFIFFRHSASAQFIGDNTRFLNVALSLVDPKPHLYIDTIKVNYQNGDTTAFTSRGGINYSNSEFLKIADKVYHLLTTDTVLLYDYALNEGDTFDYETETKFDQFIVDSIRMIQLNDGVNHRHFYLRSKNPLMIPGNAPHLTWIEDFGDKIFGWKYYAYSTFHSPYVAAICQNSSQLIYWNPENSIEPPVTESCDFDSIKKVVSIKSPINKTSVKIYPNPAEGDKISIDLEGEYNYRIYNEIGQLQNAGQLQESIDISHLKQGIYVIEIYSEKGMFSSRFVRL